MLGRSFSTGFVLLATTCVGQAFSRGLTLHLLKTSVHHRSPDFHANLGGNSNGSSRKSTAPDDNSDFPSQDESSAAAAMELTSTLARLDQQWKIQQRSKPRSRWTKLVLDETNKDLNDSEEDGWSEEPLESSVEGEVSEKQGDGDYVYLLEPPNNSVPSCLIVFVGGAGLGNYPQIAYNEFLTRISDHLNAAVLAAPYPIGLDHFSLAKKVGELSRRAIIHCEDNPARLYPSSLPTYCVGHSLGCKLLSIYMAATNQKFEGIGFMSFNNFGFSQTIGMAREFADLIRQGSTSKRKPDNSGFTGSAGNDLLNQVFSFAESVVGTIGLDFTPTPAETERLISIKYDDDREKKTRLFAFDNDQLDNSEDFIRACPGKGPAVSGLPGTHLTPVFFKIGLDQVPEEAREMTRDALGGFQSASFGNEEELDSLVDEVCGWILGKEPSRQPKWNREQPQIAGTTTTKDDQ